MRTQQQQQQPLLADVDTKRERADSQRAITVDIKNVAQLHAVASAAAVEIERK